MSEETTYRLLVQQTNHPAMPLKHVGDGEHPPWKLPLTAPAPKKKKAGKNEGGNGGDNDDDGSSTRMGIWEELFDAVDGTKIW